MRQLWILVSRNVALFLRNRTNVLLSFFSIAVVFGLYVIFLRDFMLQSVEQAGVGKMHVKEFTDRLMFGGLMIVINTTTCFGMMQQCVADVEKSIQRDFLVSSTTKFQFMIGYWMSSILVSFFFSVLALGGTEFFFRLWYGTSLECAMIIKSIGTLLFASCMNSGLLIMMVRFLKDTTAFSTFGNLYGMLCGFMAGAYLPYVMYPEWLRKVLFFYPPTQLTSILRQVNLSICQEDGKEIGSQLYQTFGVTLIRNGQQFAVRGQWGYLIFSLAMVMLLIRIENKEE